MRTALATLAVCAILAGCAREPALATEIVCADAAKPARPTLPFVEVAKDPLPPKPAQVSAKLAEAWRLAETLVSTKLPHAERDEHEAEVRQWAIDGFMPREREKRDLYRRATALLAEVEIANDLGERAIAAALDARMQESLAFDWGEVSVVECVADPTVCARAIVVVSNALRAWLDRAIARYEICEELAKYESITAWEIHCRARIDRIRSLEVIRRKGSVRP